MNQLGKIILKPGREKSILHHHPWIFSGAVESVTGSPGMGETVDVVNHSGIWLARAAYSPNSQIRARIWTWQKEQEIGPTFFYEKLANAARLRAKLQYQTNSYRLVNAESDGIPGIIMDVYGENLVIQVLSAGAEAHRDELVEAARQVVSIKAVYERSDVDVRRLEGLEERTGPILGEIDVPFELIENGIHFQVDLRTGQKTGFYLDQRNNRQRIREYACGKRILNCFCYTGGFTLYALAAGAEKVISVDSSGEALKVARENLVLNHMESEQAEWVEADVFQYLRLLRDRGEVFDLIVLDPPKFAPTASQAEQAARGYKDINLLAFKMLNPGGTLFTFSCSGGISADLFQKIIAGAALDAGVQARIIERLHPGPDHPVGLNFPEGEYLKGLICSI